MTNLEPPPQRTITTTEELQALVADALVSGTLDISHRVIDVEFNLYSLLINCGQPVIEIEVENKERGKEFKTTIKCPFTLKATHTTFNKKVHFGPITFDWGGDFSFCTFNNEATFYSAIFLAISFESSVFHKDAQFTGATFKGRTIFSSAQFNGWATFTNTWFFSDALFSSVKFNKLAIFNHSTFDRRAVFWNSEFNEYTDFDSAVFNGEADFATVFNGITSFNLVTFNQEACFLGAIFKQKVTFEKLTKTNDGILTLDISRCQITDNGCVMIDYKKHKTNPQMFLELKDIDCDGDSIKIKIRNLSEESNAKIKFKDCHFYGKNVAFTNVAMKHVSIEGGNTVKGMLFDHCHFDPTQLTQGLLKNLKFKALAGEEKWIDSQDTEKIKERALVYASLKTTATEGGETQLANDFHFWQQYYQGKLQTPILSWNWWYKISSAYGLSIGLPIAWHVLLVGVFSLGYCFLLSESSSNPLLVHLPSFNLQSTYKSIYDQCYEFLGLYKPFLFIRGYGIKVCMLE